MSENSDQLEQQLSEASGKIGLWRQLMEHPGWKLLEEELLTEANIRKEVVCSTPLGAESNIYAQEFLKGEFSGVKKALEHPQTRLEEAQREVTLLNAKLETEHDAEASARPLRSRVDTDDQFGE